MRSQRVTLEDGRYLIFYTFGEDGGGPEDGDRRGGEAGESRAEPEAAGEAAEGLRRV